MKSIKSRMQAKWRRQRMAEFAKRMHLRAGMRILDLGGTPEIWNLLDARLEVTLLNLPEETSRWETQGQSSFKFVSGDACSAEMFSDNAFDVVFSNSVIEHLRTEQQTEFARTVRRLAPSWWVQTPSMAFPIEAHCNLPFWWHYPQGAKDWWIEHWRRRGNYFLMHQMQTTQALTKERMLSLFDDCEMFIESFLGLEKSYIVYRQAVVSPG
jgi:predicted SAM-dependent methyltransferase